MGTEKQGYDKHHGQAGTFIVGTDGARQPVSPDKDGFVSIPDGKGGSQKLHRPMTKPHEDGDAPRDAKGERVDRDGAHEAAARPQPAMPEPAATPPWLVDEKRPAQATLEEKAADTTKKGGK
jgi:hypothetical protein